jgi:hypothetical protein
MKVGQKTIVRWMSKLVGSSASRSSRTTSSISARELSSEQLRQVSGGNGSSTQSPRGGW